MGTGDYGYLGPCGLWIEWIMHTVDYRYFRPYGLCGLWIQWIMDAVEYYGYSGLWVIWTM